METISPVATCQRQFQEDLLSPWPCVCFMDAGLTQRELPNTYRGRQKPRGREPDAKGGCRGRSRQIPKPGISHSGEESQWPRACLCAVTSLQHLPGPAWQDPGVTICPCKVAPPVCLHQPLTGADPRFLVSLVVHRLLGSGDGWSCAGSLTLVFTSCVTCARDC